MVKKRKVKTAGQQARSQTSAGRRRFLKTAAVTAGAAASNGIDRRVPAGVVPEHEGRQAGAGGRFLLGDQGDRGPGHQGPGLQGRDADSRPFSAAEPLGHPAAVHRHRRHRVLLPAPLAAARHAAAHRPGKDQVVGQGGADLHQGRVSGRPQGVQPGRAALRSAVRERAGGDKKFATKAPPSGSPAYPRFTTPTRWAFGPTWSSARSRAGPNCSTPSGRARPRSCRCPVSASWTRPWRSKRAATSSTRTKAT